MSSSNLRDLKTASSGTNVVSAVVDMLATPTPGTNGQVSTGLVVPAGAFATRYWIETLTPFGNHIIINKQITGDLSFGDVIANEEAQSFTIPATITAPGLVVFLKNPTSQTGNLYLDIFAADGFNQPTGSSLATSDALDVSTLQTTYTSSGTTFNFSSPPILTPGTYVFVLSSPEPLSGPIDIGTTATYLAETHSSSTDTGSSWSPNADGLAFKIKTNTGISAFLLLQVHTDSAFSPLDSLNLFALDINTPGQTAGVVVTGGPGAPTLARSTGITVTFQDGSQPINYGSFKITAEYLLSVPQP